MDADSWQELYRRATANHGVIGPADLDWVGITPSSFARFAKTHGCQQRHRGAWTLPGTSWSFLCQAACAVTVLGPPMMITGEAGLHLHGVMIRRPKQVDVIVPSSRSGRGHRRVSVRRSRRFYAVPVRTVDGMPLACVEQCLVDASPSLPVELLCKLMAAACRLRLTTLEAIASYGNDLRRFSGSISFRAALTTLGGEMVHSDVEQVARDALRPHELGIHPRPYAVTHEGRTIAEIDLAMADILYGVEVDGPHHELPDQRRWDEQRDQDLRDLGWRIDRHPWDDVLADPEGFAVRVAQVATQRRTTLGLPLMP